jgi:hypothetical protein
VRLKMPDIARLKVFDRRPVVVAVDSAIEFFLGAGV